MWDCLHVFQLEFGISRVVLSTTLSTVSTDNFIHQGKKMKKYVQFVRDSLFLFIFFPSQKVNCRDIDEICFKGPPSKGTSRFINQVLTQ